MKERGIITVVGKDKIGINAKVCIFISEKKINILDISQTIVSGYFNMMMIVDLSSTNEKLEDLAIGLEKIGKELGVIVKLQHEEIFNSMHRI